MTTYNETGGPAFPVPAGCGEEQGMTLRDYFAGQWLAGYIANPGIGYGTREDEATAAYAMADAMLKERNKR